VKYKCPLCWREVEVETEKIIIVVCCACIEDMEVIENA